MEQSTEKHMVVKAMTTRAKLLKTGGTLLLALSLSGIAVAQQSQYPPLFRSNWTQVAPEGFGDRQNSWAWGSQWFNGKLLIGTNRAEACVAAEAQHIVSPSHPYPPTDPDISCTTSPNNLPLQAEIWSWDPSTTNWTMVYQSPDDLQIPGTNPAKFTARDMGYRGMTTFTESDGTNALYVGSCSTKEIHTALPGGRLLRSTDGVNFAPVPQDPGTFLGNYGNACFRGLQTFNGNLYMLAGSFQGGGVILESSNPKAGDNAYQIVSPISQQAYELYPFNGYLYVTFVDKVNGFSLTKTNAQGTPPYVYTTVIPNGGYKTPYPNTIALSMSVFGGRLYVGGDGVHAASAGGGASSQGAELFRANPDDTWDLVAGTARNTPVGFKNPLSGLGPGFGWTLNAHMWRQEIYDNRLYVGTFDESTIYRNSPKYAASVKPELGFDLWWSPDGAYFSLVDQNGFEDGYNFGVRSLIATPYGLFLGSANYYYGLEMWQGIPTGFVAGGAQKPRDAVVRPAAPAERLQVEGNSRALLSWDQSASAKQYHVFRHTFNAATGGTASDLFAPTAFAEIAVTSKPYFVDPSVTGNIQYGYEVKAEDRYGNLTAPSNYVQFPSPAQPVSFRDVQALANQMASGQKFVSPAAQQNLFVLLGQAHQTAQKGDFSALQSLWQAVKTGGAQWLQPLAADDLQFMLGRLVSRATLAQGGVLSASALE